MKIFLVPLASLQGNLNIYRGASIVLFLMILGLLGVLIIQKQRQMRANKQANHYRSLLEASPTAMLIFQDYKLKYVNAAMERLTGYSFDQLLSMEIWQLIHPQSLSDLNSDSWLVRNNGNRMRLEFQIKTSQNQVVWVDFSAQLIDFEQKPAFLATALNIDEKKQFEARLIEAEERYSLIVLATNDGISDYSIDSDSLYLSLQWKEMLGYKEHEIANTLEAWLELIHAEDYNKALKMFKKIKSGEIPAVETEYRMRCKDGTYRWVQVKLTVVFDSQSHPVRVLGTHSDVDQKKKNEEILRESEFRYKSLFSQNSAIMLITNPDTGAIEDANAAACTYYGYRQEDLTGMNISDICLSVPEQQPALAASPANSQHLRHKLKSGDIRDVEVFQSGIELHGRVLNHLIIYDVTQRKLMEIELKAAKEQAEAAVLAKSLFISSVSHEIRTPLNAIIGLADLMVNEEDIPAGMEENLRSIKFSSDHLLGIINDVLDFSKLEANKVGIDNTHFSLHQLINDSVNAVRFKIRGKNINLRVRIQPDVPQIVLSDSSRLKQILLNLLSNSIKFTEEGHIDVFAKVIEQSDKKCRIRFAVSDTGIGIAEEKQNSLFESFSQAESHTFRKYGGTGLGLSISKKLTKLLGGQIGVKSIEGIGSTFWFEIPMEISEQSFSEEVNQSTTSTEDLSALRVLLVEDDKMNQFVMTKVLKRWKINLDVADNGLEALRKLEQHPYHLVLMDVHMPLMDGYEATRMLRQGKAGAVNARVPVIALTADITNETRALVRESGMNDYLSKPCEQQVLVGKLRKFGPDLKEKPGELLQTAQEDRKQIRKQIKQALWGIFDDDIQATRSMIRHFLKQVPENVLQAKASLAVLDIESACQNLHKVKPGFSYLGFPEVSELVDKLQKMIRSRQEETAIGCKMQILEQEIKKIVGYLQEVLIELEIEEMKR